MNHPSFESFLKDRHAEDYHGTDDDMPDAFDSWICDLGGEEYITYAEMWGKTIHDYYAIRENAPHINEEKI